MTSALNNPLFVHKSAWDDPYDPTVRLQDLHDFCDAGVAPAIHDAWVLIIDNDLAVPPWLAAPTKAVIARGLSMKQVPYQSKMRHYYRWRKVKELLSKGVKWDDVFEKASAALLGSEYFRGHHAMKDSYDKVQRALKDPKAALQYYTAMKETRYITGTSFQRKKK